MNYSDNPAVCRVDFCKESGKWYATEEVVFRSSDYDAALVHDAFIHALEDALAYKPPAPDAGKLRYAGMWAICLEPYHQHEHPLMIRVPERVGLDPEA